MYSKIVLPYLIVQLIAGCTCQTNGPPSFRSDYTYLEETKSFYKLHKRESTWFEAKRTCEDEGATLLIVEDEAEAHTVLNFVEEPKPWGLLVGINDLSDEGVFTTIDGRSISDVYNIWREGEPNDEGGKEDCVLIYSGVDYTAQLNDLPCDYRLPFVCKKKLDTEEQVTPAAELQIAESSTLSGYQHIGTSGDSYKLHSIGRTWHQASDKCASENAVLWPRGDENEISDILQLIMKRVLKTRSTLERGFSILWSNEEPTVDEFEEENCKVIISYMGDVEVYNPLCGRHFSFVCKKIDDVTPTTEHQDIDSENVQVIETTTTEQISEPFFRNDYTYVEVSGSFYKLNRDYKPWSEAISTCASENATLWIAEDEDEAYAVLGLIDDPKPWAVYLGISDIETEGVFKTIDGRPISDVYYKWREGEPNDVEGREDCVVMYSDNMYRISQFNDIPCEVSVAFVCKKTLDSLNNQEITPTIEPQNLYTEAPEIIEVSTVGQQTEPSLLNDYTYVEIPRSFYKLHRDYKPWFEAISTCASENATLWIAEDEDEAYAVLGLIDDPKPWAVYLGISDIETEGVFKTIDGRPISDVYYKWREGEPNDVEGREDCVVMYSDNMYRISQFNDIPCEVSVAFVCKKTLDSLNNQEITPTIEPQNLYTEAPEIIEVSTVGQQTEPSLLNDYTYVEIPRSFYKLHRDYKPWSKAISTCASENATLWIAEDEDEAYAVLGLIDDPKPWAVYLGISDIETEGVFKTIDGRPISDVYYKWREGEPNDVEGREDCVVMYSDNMYRISQFNDIPCEVSVAFVCKMTLDSLNNQESTRTSELLSTEAPFAYGKPTETIDLAEIIESTEQYQTARPTETIHMAEIVETIEYQTTQVIDTTNMIETIKPIVHYQTEKPTEITNMAETTEQYQNTDQQHDDTYYIVDNFHFVTKPFWDIIPLSESSKQIRDRTADSEHSLSMGQKEPNTVYNSVNKLKLNGLLTVVPMYVMRFI